MRLRTISKRFCVCLAAFLGGAVAASGASGQDATGFYTDPGTGVVYRKVQRSIERPVVETQMRTQESTVYRPETVVTSRPETRTVYSPTVSYGWEPRLANRWNPFMQPTVVYQHVPRTHWETRSETVERQESRTNWVAETRKIDVPQQIVRIQRETKDEFEPVGKVASPQPAAPPNSTESAIAARLRPMDSGTRIEPLYGNSVPSSAYANNNAYRNDGQRGMPVNNLYPNQSPVYSSPLPPASSGLGVAGLPLTPIWR